MSSLKIKGMEIGNGKPKICVSIVERNLNDILLYAKKILESDAEIVEWRADFFENAINKNEVIQAAKSINNILGNLPIIFTFRNKDEGGIINIDRSYYLEVIKSISEMGIFDFIDIELSKIDTYTKDIINEVKKNGTNVIMSYHIFKDDYKIENIIKLSQEMVNMDADIVKVALMCESPMRLIEILDFSQRFVSDYSIPSIVIAMGKEGALSRVLGEKFGSSITFCSLEKSSAPGQINVSDAKKMINMVHKII